MGNQFSKFIVYALIILAMLGLVGTLSENPESIIKMIVGALASVFLIYALFKYFTLKSDNKKRDGYKNAVKQSKKMHSSQKQKKEAQPAIKRSATRSSNSFTVIEGKKKKNYFSK